MKYVDMNNWKRKKYYDFFMNLKFPRLNICLDVDVLKFYNTIKKHGYHFYSSMGYVVCLACNDVKEFRYRIRDKETVVCYDVVHPIFTVLAEDNLFSYTNGCRFEDDFKEYSIKTEQAMRVAENEANCKMSGPENKICITTLPWYSFTGVHTFYSNAENLDSTPWFVWGKFYKQNDKLLMPMSIQAHHGLCDGYHINLLLERMRYYLDNFEDIINSGLIKTKDLNVTL